LQRVLELYLGRDHQTFLAFKQESQV